MTSKRFAILIGSSQFNDPELQGLRCPIWDVNGLADILASKEYGNFSEIIQSINEPHYVVLEKINEVFIKAERDDLILIYFSGHGKLNRMGKLRLTTQNTQIQKLDSTSVPVEWLKDLITDTSRTNRIVIILDCCHSGAIGDAFFTKGDLDGQYQALSRGRGTYIITASTAIDVAIERMSDEYGAFTKFIIEGIKSWDAADENGNVTVDSLFSYLNRRMQKEIGKSPKKWDLDVEDELIIATRGKARTKRTDPRTPIRIPGLPSGQEIPVPVFWKRMPVILALIAALIISMIIIYSMINPTSDAVPGTSNPTTTPTLFNQPMLGRVTGTILFNNQPISTLTNQTAEIHLTPLESNQIINTTFSDAQTGQYALQGVHAGFYNTDISLNTSPSGSHESGYGLPGDFGDFLPGLNPEIAVNPSEAQGLSDVLCNLKVIQAIHLIEPVDNRNTSSSYWDRFGPTVYAPSFNGFVWEPVPGATKYNVKLLAWDTQSRQIQTMVYTTPSIIDEIQTNTTNPSCTFNFGGEQKTSTYELRITAFNNKDEIIGSLVSFPSYRVWNTGFKFVISDSERNPILPTAYPTSIMTFIGEPW